jgi:hypothetical protein
MAENASTRHYASPPHHAPQFLRPKADMTQAQPVAGALTGQMNTAWARIAAVISVAGLRVRTRGFAFGLLPAVLRVRVR